MHRRGIAICLLGLGLFRPVLLEAQALRLQRRAPDLLLGFRPTYRAEGQQTLSLVLGGGSAKGLAHIGVF
mgnify:FL=1